MVKIKGKSLFCSDNFDIITQNLHDNGITAIDVEILISMENPFYDGSLFEDHCRFFRESILKDRDLIYNNKKFYINTLRFTLADSLNRHNILYREVVNHNKNKKKKKDNIKELRKSSYIISKKQGHKWLKKNINTINEFIPQDHRLTQDFILNKERMLLYKGDDKTPKIELWSYDYWLNHPEYKKTEKALQRVCNLEDGLIQRSLLYETNYFIERRKNREEKIEFEELLRKQSYKYLFDETVSFTIKHREQNNVIEFYFGGNEPKQTLTFRGKKAKKNPIIQKYLQSSLKGADQRKYVSIKVIKAK
ncbi:hypothetical protein ACFL0U_04340 [Pseudomonadota bacterium]